ncbi:MAG: GGDEF domain-containing protein [Lachnospiraceae bacterium]|nr:GGDEF domain-containing protein [Lachnospiraceae bacterium]
MYYASIGLLSLIVVIIVNYTALKNPQNGRRPIVQRRYRHFLIAVMTYFVTDIFWGYFYERRWVAITFADTTIYFMAMVISVLLWTRFVVSYLENKGTFAKMLLSAGYILTVYEAVVLIINFFTPIVFGFNEEKEYMPNSARFITLIMQMGLFFMTSVYSMFNAYRLKGLKRSRYRAIAISGIFMTAFIALQAFLPLMPMYAIGCLLATCVIHTFVYWDETVEYDREIGTAKQLAYKDALTGVGNKLAYQEKQTAMDAKLSRGALRAFGVVVFDLNGLKNINDTKGHEAGDEYIKAATDMIGQIFPNSPLYRIGGDEFVAVLEGHDYMDRNRLILTFEEEVLKNQKEGRVVISSGLSVFKPYDDKCYNDVFVRADRMMYERKGYLKGLAKE